MSATVEIKPDISSRLRMLTDFDEVTKYDPKDPLYILVEKEKKKFDDMFKRYKASVYGQDKSKSEQTSKKNKQKKSKKGGKKDKKKDKGDKKKKDKKQKDKKTKGKSKKGKSKNKSKEKGSDDLDWVSYA